MYKHTHVCTRQAYRERARHLLPSWQLVGSPARRSWSNNGLQTYLIDESPQDIQVLSYLDMPPLVDQTEGVLESWLVVEGLRLCVSYNCSCDQRVFFSCSVSDSLLLYLSPSLSLSLLEAICINLYNPLTTPIISLVDIPCDCCNKIRRTRARCMGWTRHYNTSLYHCMTKDS